MVHRLLPTIWAIESIDKKYNRITPSSKRLLNKTQFKNPGHIYVQRYLIKDFRFFANDRSFDLWNDLVRPPILSANFRVH